MIQKIRMDMSIGSNIQKRRYQCKLKQDQVIAKMNLMGIPISKNRSKDIARPRQIAMYLCKNMTDTPLDSIGALLGGRDHSTIIHGVQKISDEYESDETTRSLIDTIKKKINPN